MHDIALMMVMFKKNFQSLFYILNNTILFIMGGLAGNLISN